jgi:hypothetical protein
MRTVTVVNLVCEDSIEHRILHLLTQKQGLADGVLDGRGDLEALKMPSGRAAMVERMAGFLSASPPSAPVPTPDPAQRFLAEIADRLDESVLSIERRRRDDGTASTIVVVDGAAGDVEGARRFLAEAAAQSGLAAVEFVDRAAWDAIQRLAETGLIRLAEADEVVYRSPVLDASPDAAARADRLRRNRIASDWLGQAERKLRMAALLADGGFDAEALAPIDEASSMALRGLAIVVDPGLDPHAAEALSEADLAELATVRGHLPPGTVAHLGSSRPAGMPDLAASRAAAEALLVSARTAAGQIGSV